MRKVDFLTRHCIKTLKKKKPTNMMTTKMIENNIFVTTLLTDFSKTNKFFNSLDATCKMFLKYEI